MMHHAANGADDGHLANAIAVPLLEMSPELTRSLSMLVVTAIAAKMEDFPAF